MKTIGSWCFWNNQNRQFFHSELFYNKKKNTPQMMVLWFGNIQITKTKSYFNKIKYPPQHWSVSVFGSHRLSISISQKIWVSGKLLDYENSELDGYQK
jgi:hypothetical protein